MKPLTILPLNLITDFVDYCNSIQELTVIIVEGKRDIQALKAIGIELINGRILAHKGYSMNDLIDQVVSTPVIINLVDFADLAATWMAGSELADIAEMAQTWLENYQLPGAAIKP